MARTIVIGSRGSKLALWQAHFVQNRLQEAGHESRIEIIQTQGDKIQHLSFDKMEGKGFFTKEIEEALLNRSIDLAVHSHKDLETKSPVGLTIAAVSDREDPADWLLIREEAYTPGLEWGIREGGVIGTSSARRKAQVAHHRNDLEIRDLRGNVPTRVNKLKEGQYDAIVLAAAGLTRLNLDLTGLRVEKLDPRVFVSAPAQGVLGLQIREEDEELGQILSKLNSPQVAEVIGVEREVLRLMDGGCQLPLGVYCTAKDGQFSVWAALAETADSPVKKVFLEANSPKGLANDVVEALKKKAQSPS